MIQVWARQPTTLEQQSPCESVVCFLVCGHDYLGLSFQTTVVGDISGIQIYLR